MHVSGPGQVHGAQGVNPPHFNHKPSKAAAAPQQVDQLDISPAARAASESQATDGVRTDLVNRLRSEIASGAYETPEKLDAALDRLLDQVG